MNIPTPITKEYWSSNSTETNVAKTEKSKKRIQIELDLGWAGKRRKPDVTCGFALNGYEGLPADIDMTVFLEGAYDLCRKLIETGEFD